jgi:hypothetical protein
MMNDVTVGEGASEDPTVIAPGDVETVETETAIEARHLDEWWVTHLRRNQETTVRVTFRLQADLPVVGTVQLPVDVLTYRTRLETDLLGTKNATGGKASGRRIGMGIGAPIGPPLEPADRERSPVVPAAR